MNLSNVQTPSYYNSYPKPYTPVAFNGYGSALAKLNRITIDEYNSLNKSEKYYLRALFYLRKLLLFANFHENLGIHEQTAKVLKQGLDKKYGEGNYVLVSIGRSLSSIAKVLSYRIGEENVKQIPMSYARRFCGENPFRFDSSKGVKRFKNYLSSVGLTKEQIRTSKKIYVFIDYCITGDSLRGAENLFRNKRVLGDCDNIVFSNINDIIRPVDRVFAEEMYCNYFDGMYFKDNYTLVDNCYKLKHIRKAADIKLSNKAKLFFFSILDRMKKKEGNVLK